MEDFLNSKKRTSALAALILFILTLALFGDVIFSLDSRVLSKAGLDAFQGEIFARDFEFREIKKGNFPLWNPYVYAGVPFFDGVSSTALYPPNYLHLLLPLPQAINIGIALHTFLVGFFMYLWIMHRRLHPLACLLPAVLVMFSGPYFLHIYAGHLGNLCAMTWTPLLFLAIDGLRDRPTVGWGLLGIFAVTMQVLAAQPQYVYYTAIAAALYCLFSWAGAAERKLFIVGLLAIFCGSLLISFIQIWPGITAAGEGIRSQGVSLRYAAMFSFPPENFLTWLAPSFFGDMETMPYWGRCYLWEMSLFIGVTGFFLALYGACYGAKNKRRFALTMAAILLLLSLGAHTPLFNLLYHYLPGFNKFRGASKFIFPASLFLAMLAGIGLDNLIKHPRVSRKFIYAPLVTGIIILTLALLIPVYADQWAQLMQQAGLTGEAYLLPQAYRDTAFLANAGKFASGTLLTAGLLCLAIAFLLLLRKYGKIAVYILTLLAVAEMLLFASANRPTFDMRATRLEEFKRFRLEHPGDYRVLNRFIPNMAVSTQIGDIWGYGPAVPRRYAEFIAFTQGMDPDKGLQTVNFRHYHPLYKMLRCRYIITPREEDILIHDIAPQILPRLLLVRNWQTFIRRDDIFREMAKTTFDPRHTVILESKPLPQPSQGEETGSMFLATSSTDYLQIHGKINRPAILLITDSYNGGWQARALPGSIQQTYQVMPANYTLMAIPLAAGEHRLTLEYLPPAFKIGQWVSLFSLGIYLVVLVCYLAKRRKNKGGNNQ